MQLAETKETIMDIVELARKLYASLNRPGQRPDLLVLVHPDQFESLRAELGRRAGALPFRFTLAADPTGLLVRRPGEAFGINQRRYDFFREMAKPPHRRSPPRSNATVLFTAQPDVDDLEAWAKNGSLMEYEEAVS